LGHVDYSCHVPDLRLSGKGLDINYIVLDTESDNAGYAIFAQKNPAPIVTNNRSKKNKSPIFS